MHIEHKGLGIAFDLPEFVQRDVETFFRSAKDIENSIRDVDDQTSATTLVEFLTALKESKIKLEAEQLKVIVNEFMLNLRLTWQKRDFVSSPELAGVYTRTAARLGWLGGISEDDVDTLKPAIVTFISEKVQAAVVESYKIPPE